MVTIYIYRTSADAEGSIKEIQLYLYSNCIIYKNDLIMKPNQTEIN